MHWTGDGQVAFLTSAELEFGNRVEMLRFGAGLPSALAPVPNLPSWGDYQAPAVSLDSTRALFVDNDSGAYLVSLSGAEEALRVADADAMTRASFCADSDTWVATMSDGQETLVTLKGKELSSRDLGFGYVTLSPESQLLLMKLRTVAHRDLQRSFNRGSPFDARWLGPVGAHASDRHRQSALLDPMARR